MDDKEIFEQIKQHILDQADKHERIDTEHDLAERFQVTRYRVRKALNALSQLGILDRAPKRGIRVIEVVPEELSEQIGVRMDVANFDVREFIEARLVIEVAVLPLAIRRLTPAMEGKMERAIQNIVAHAKEPLVADKYDREFHLLLLEACGNRILQVFSATLVAYFDKTTHSVANKGPEFFEHIARAERGVFEAMRMGDSDAAIRRLEHHLREQVSL